MSLEENKALTRHVIQSFNDYIISGDPDRIKEVFTDNFLWHFTSQPAMNREQFIEFTVNLW
jgi:hypothetical protein